MHPFSSNPFSWLSPRAYGKALWLLGVMTLLLAAALKLLDRPLTTAAAPLGIVSLELAGSIEQTRGVLDSWDTGAKISAALSLGIDFLFLVLYTLFLALAVFLLARGFETARPRFYALGLLLTRLLFLAGLLDALENLALIGLLTGMHREMLPLLAFYSATLKFTLILAGLLYLTAGLIQKPFIRDH